jgi:hypothetical protein
MVNVPVMAADDDGDDDNLAGGIWMIVGCTVFLRHPLDLEIGNEGLHFRERWT